MLSGPGVVEDIHNWVVVVHNWVAVVNLDKIEVDTVAKDKFDPDIHLGELMLDNRAEVATTCQSYDQSSEISNVIGLGSIST